MKSWGDYYVEAFMMDVFKKTEEGLVGYGMRRWIPDIHVLIPGVCRIGQYRDGEGVGVVG